MEQTLKLVPPRSTARYNPFVLLVYVHVMYSERLYLLGPIWYSSDICWNLSHCCCILLQALVCQELARPLRRTTRDWHTHLSNEMLDTLPNVDIRIVKFSSNFLGFL